MEDIKNFSIFIFEDDKIQATALKNYINEYSQDISNLSTHMPT